MQIRSATAADLATVMELGKRTFFDAFAAMNDPADMAAYLATAFAPEQMAAEIADPLTRLLLIYPSDPSTTAPVGYAQLLTASAKDCVPAARPIELVRLYVDQSAIGQGYGAKLMQACLEDAAQQGGDVLWLGVWEKNYHAQRFYQRWGFQQVGAHDFVVGQDIQKDWIYMRPVALDKRTCL